MQRKLTDYYKRLSPPVNGQLGGAFGYGGIVDPIAYLSDKYNAQNVKLLTSRTLPINTSPMRTFTKTSRACVLAGLTRIFSYYLHTNLKESFFDIEKVAWGRGFNSKFGTNPFCIGNITKAIFKDVGSVTTKHHVLYSFPDHIKKEIDAKRPLLFNCAQGYYLNHTVTICGYSIYANEDSYHQLLHVVDSWHDKVLYLDFDYFATHYLDAGIGSVTLIKFEK